MDFPLVDIHTHGPHVPHQVSVYAHDALAPAPLPGRPYSTGIHPWDAQNLNEDPSTLHRFRDSITPQTVAIGEIGLDFHTARTVTERHRQVYWLHRQGEEAAERRLPIILHCVRAWEELFSALQELPSIPTVIHGFSGSPQLAERLLSVGCHLSYGRGLFRSPKARASLRITPPDRLFLETDTQTEFPLRKIYERAAEERQLPMERLQAIVYTNFQRLFNLRQSL